MGCSKYKLTNSDFEFLAYSNEGEELNLLWDVEQLESDIDPSKAEYNYLPIYHISETWDFKKQTRDKRLESEGVTSFINLSYAYQLIREKKLPKSRAIREAIIEKYTDILQFINDESI